MTARLLSLQSNYYRRLLVLWQGSCISKAQKPVTLVPFMWFWSVSWSTNCPVFFSFFLVDQKKIVQSQGIFGQSLGIFGRPNFFLVYQNFSFSIPKNQSLTKKKSETDQKFPETEQIFFWSTKKVRNRPDNWLTKRLTKTTWTGLWTGLNSNTGCPTFLAFIFEICFFTT